MHSVESVVRGHCKCCQPSLAWVLKLASALCSARNVAHTCYPGNHVTVRLVECAKMGKTEGLCELRLVRLGGGGQLVCVCVDAPWRGVWEMAAERMTVCSLLYLGASYTDCHVWSYAD